MSCPVLFWDVDTQHDFMDADGRLAVPGAEAIVPNLARLTEFAVEHGIPIVATADAHPPHDAEFEEFGEHCVAGTPGQRKIGPSLAIGHLVADPGALERQLARLAAGEVSQLIIEKRELDVFAGPVADEVLACLQPERVVVYGVATEYCVRAQVLSLRRRGCGVTVLTDAVRGIDAGQAEAALAEMREAGAEVATTQELLDALSPAGTA